MAEKKYTLTESELVQLVDALTTQRINEQTNAAPARDASVKFVTKTLDADSLFDTGKADPDTDSKSFNDTVDAIVNAALNKNIKKPFTVKVQGGASAVGSPKFDNKGLADRRRDNMINFLTQDAVRRLTTELGTTSGLGFKQNDYFTFQALPSVVGKATVKDSPEAKKEQFVKVSYPVGGTVATNATTAIDKTATKIPGQLGTGGKLTANVEVIMKTKDTGKTILLSPGIIDSLNKVMGKHGYFFGTSSKMKGVS